MDRTGLLDALKNVASEVTLEEQNKYYKSGAYSPIYPKICTVRKVSEMNCGNYHQTSSIIGSTELYERAESAPIRFEDPVAGYPIYIKKRSFDLGVEVTMELDSGVPQIKNFLKAAIREKMMPAAVARTKEKFVASFFNKGSFTTPPEKPFGNSIAGVISPSYGNYIYDGKILFATNHPAKAHTTTYSNNGGALPLTYDNMLTGDIAFTGTNAKMENGEPFDNTMDNFLMVNPILRGTAKKLLESEYNPSNANNDVNQMRGNYTPVVNPYFTNNSSAAWMLGNKAGLWFFDSDTVEYDIWIDHETRQIKCAAHIDLGGGIVNWRGYWMANGASS